MFRPTENSTALWNEFQKQGEVLRALSAELRESNKVFDTAKTHEQLAQAIAYANQEYNRLTPLIEVAQDLTRNAHDAYTGSLIYA